MVLSAVCPQLRAPIRQAKDYLSRDCKGAAVRVDPAGVYPLFKTVFSIPVDDLFLLGVLNSRPAWEFLKNECTVLGDADQNGRLTLQEIFVSKLPIPLAPETEKKQISKLVKTYYDSNGENCEKTEQEIDLRVAALYGIELSDLSSPLIAKRSKRGS